MKNESEKLVNLIDRDKNVDALKSLDKILKKKCSDRIEKILKK